MLCKVMNPDSVHSTFSTFVPEVYRLQLSKKKSSFLLRYLGLFVFVFFTCDLFAKMYFFKLTLWVFFCMEF